MPQFYHTELKRIGLADGSAAKSTCSFYKGPTFGSHHPHKAAHNHPLSPVPGNSMAHTWYIYI